jgi:hypothetical protein
MTSLSLLSVLFYMLTLFSGFWPLLVPLGLVIFPIGLYVSHALYAFPAASTQTADCRFATFGAGPLAFLRTSVVSKLSSVASLVSASTLGRLLPACAFASDATVVSSLAASVGAVLLADSLLWPLATLAAIRTIFPLPVGGLSVRICHGYCPWTQVWHSYRPRIWARIRCCPRICVS